MVIVSVLLLIMVQDTHTELNELVARLGGECKFLNDEYGTQKDIYIYTYMYIYIYIYIYIYHIHILQTYIL